MTQHDYVRDGANLPDCMKDGPVIDGIHWNILGQVYSPTHISDIAFSWKAIFPIETFVSPHIHTTQDEYVFIKSGSLNFVLDGLHFAARAGNLVHLPKGISHGIFNNSGANVECLFAVTPTGKLVDLFRKIHNLAHPGKVTDVAKNYDVNFLPPIRAIDAITKT